MINDVVQWNIKNQNDRKIFSSDKRQFVYEISTHTQPLSPLTLLQNTFKTSSKLNDNNYNKDVKCIRINAMEVNTVTNGKCDKIKRSKKNINNNEKQTSVQLTNIVQSTCLVKTSKKRRRLKHKSQSLVNNVNFWRTKNFFKQPSTCDLIKILPLCFHISLLVFLWCINLDLATATLSETTIPKQNDKQFSSLLENYMDDDVDSNRQSAFNDALSNPDIEGYDGHYTHTWAVHIPNGEDNDLANTVARDHGFTNLGKIFDDHYHFAHHRLVKRSITPALEHQSRLENDERVFWAQQQKAKSRQKRDFIGMRSSRTSPRGVSLVDSMPFIDPKWPTMWYLNRGGGFDMNVIPAWKEGITGKGIVVTILDDGLESDHPDIKDNYDPLASYDVNSHDDDPMPHYDMTDSNRHGTRCAGEVAATANNSYCAVGIAFGASVGGVRMLDGDVTDAVEARSLSHNMHHVDIYSASWGPDDDGKTVDGPGELASRAFIEGVTKGRKGKGSIFIWASGNGGRELDNCNCDGYTNSIWTLSISSATEGGHVPWYSEKCSSTLATTYSSGGQGEKQVVTTDLHHTCTLSHTGTSASAPLAAGIAALVLESNTNLTWRDLQHIVVRTAKPANLKDPTWSRNGVGRRISHSFGYGLMDAAAMVRVARTWKTVPEQQRCEINAPHVDKVIPPKSYIRLQLTVKHCESVNFLEHVQAKVSLTTQRRGDIQLHLKSPAGTRVTLLTSRAHDTSRTGFNQWPFMSVHTWGESPHGNWQLEIHNEGKYMAQITQWDLIVYGTKAPPQPEDLLQRNPGQSKPFGNDIEQNDIESDTSSQWHNMQQMGESSVISSDITNTSCLQMTIDQRCLVCSASTFLFEGHCLMECPFHTFSMAQPLPQQDALKLNLNVSTLSKAVEQSEDLQALDGSNETPNTLHTCNMCDDSCYTCYGPLSSQCSSCYAGSQLRKQAQRNENYCFVLSERSSGQYAGNGDTMSKNHENGATVSDNLRSITGVAKLILFLVPSLIFSLLLVLLILQCYLKPKTIKTTTIGVSYKRNNYDRVSLLPYKNEKINEEEKLFLAPNEEIAQDLKTHEQKKQEITMHIEDSECDEL